MKLDCTHFPEVISQLVNLSETLANLQKVVTNSDNKEAHSLKAHWLWKIENAKSMLQDVTVLPPAGCTHQKDWQTWLGKSKPSYGVLLLKMM